MSSIGERIKKSMTDKGLTPYKLNKLTGISQSTIGRILKNENVPNRTTIDAISLHLDVSSNWILTGSDYSRSENKPTMVNEETVKPLLNSNGNKFKELENGKFIMTVPLIPAKAYATYISECCDGETVEGFNEVNFYVDQYARGNYVAFEIKGDSMDNGGLYDNPEGCITLCRELGKHHWKDGFKDSQYGWIIVHRDTILCKDIVEQDLVNGIITCHSRNTSPEYADFEVKLDEVMQIFKIIKRTF